MNDHFVLWSAFGSCRFALVLAYTRGHAHTCLFELIPLINHFLNPYAWLSGNVLHGA